MRTEEEIKNLLESYSGRDAEGNLRKAISRLLQKWHCFLQGFGANFES